MLLFFQDSYAQILSYMPAPNQLITSGQNYDLPYLVGMRFDTDNPLEFTFVLNRGSLERDGMRIRREVDKNARYFLAALSLPAKDLWVNLSPYESGRIISSTLSLTDLGKDMLGEDYVLKQLASSLTYPESEVGKKYWDTVYKKMFAKLRTTKLTADSFSKIWIVPGEMRLSESSHQIVIEKARLKVMMEKDYLASRKHAAVSNLSGAQQEVADLSEQAMRETILPLIEKEVNEGKHFAQLRQLYRAVILANWFKNKLKNSMLGSHYFDQGKIRGSESADRTIKEKIYNEYVKAFNSGVYDYVRTEKDPVFALRRIKRRYFSGGENLAAAANPPVFSVDDAKAEKMIASMGDVEASEEAVNPRTGRRLLRVISAPREDIPVADNNHGAGPTDIATHDQELLDLAQSKINGPIRIILRDMPDILRTLRGINDAQARMQAQDSLKERLAKAWLDDGRFAVSHQEILESLLDIWLKIDKNIAKEYLARIASPDGVIDTILADEVLKTLAKISWHPNAFMLLEKYIELSRTEADSADQRSEDDIKGDKLKGFLQGAYTQLIGEEDASIRSRPGLVGSDGIPPVYRSALDSGDWAEVAKVFRDHKTGDGASAVAERLVYAMIGSEGTWERFVEAEKLYRELPDAKRDNAVIKDILVAADKFLLGDMPADIKDNVEKIYVALWRLKREKLCLFMIKPDLAAAIARSARIAAKRILDAGGDITKVDLDELHQSVKVLLMNARRSVQTLSPAETGSGNKGGLDFAQVSTAEARVEDGGVAISFDQALEFLQRSDFSGIGLITTDLRF